MQDRLDEIEQRPFRPVVNKRVARSFIRNALAPTSTAETTEEMELEGENVRVVGDYEEDADYDDEDRYNEESYEVKDDDDMVDNF